MKRDGQKDAYQAAYNEAASELRKIFGEVERLRIRREHVAKLVEVLNRRFGFDEGFGLDPLIWQSRFEGVSVVTRVNVIHADFEVDE
ncbi:MAG: hypothetical protein WBF42_08510 [Terracidiphilus sp.]